MRKTTHSLPRLVTALLGLILLALFPAEMLADYKFNYTYKGNTFIFEHYQYGSDCWLSSVVGDVTGDLEIPSSAYDSETDTYFPVVAIGDGREYHNIFGESKISSIIIPSTITGINPYAFYKASIQTLTIPSSVSGIYENAFYGAKIETLNIADGVSKIDDGAFAGAELTSVNIPASVTSIGKNAFYGCKGLTSFTIPETVTSIGNNAFAGIETITLLGSPQAIGNGAFYSCTSLILGELESLPEGLEKAFKHVNFVKVAIPTSMSSDIYSPIFNANGRIVDYIPTDKIIEDGWIWDNDKSTIYFAPASLEGEYTIPDNVYKIEDGAFEYCENLTAVNIPNSLFQIGKRSFAFSGLVSIEIPSSVRSIGNYAFDNCNNLETAIIGEDTDYAWIKQTIEYDAFNRCRSLKSVKIGSSVNFISSSAFSDCTSLTSVSLPDSPTRKFSIANGVFQRCTSLTEITIPSSVESISKNAFSGCTALESVTYDTDEPVTAEENIFDETTYQTATLYMPRRTLAKIDEYEPWKLFQTKKPLDGNKFDINGDNNVDVNDVVALVSLITDNTGDPAIHDLNNDGRVDVADIVALINEILNQ